MIDTTGHMTAAYVVATIVYLLYSVSLWLRGRRYRDRLDGDGRE